MDVFFLLQSSCTRPDLEAESTHMENMQEFLQPVRSIFSLTDMNLQKPEMHVNLGQKLLLHDREAEGKSTQQFHLALSYLLNSLRITNILCIFHLN